MKIQPRRKIAPKKTTNKKPTVVSIGDSLTAGVQDLRLDHRLQAKSFPKLFASQIGAEFQNPEIRGGSIPAEIFHADSIPFAKLALKLAQSRLAFALPSKLLKMGIKPPKWTMWPLFHLGGMGKQKGSDDTHNFAVPGFELRHLHEVGNVSDYLSGVVRKEDSRGMTQFAAPWVKAILQKGEGEKVGRTEIDHAIAKKPDIVTLWAGNNDTLAAGSSGNLSDSHLTPIEDRRWRLKDGNETERVMPGLRSSMVGENGVLTRLLKETEAEVLLMNIPDVTTTVQMLKLGEKVGPLPFRVKLPNGTDLTKKLEDFRLPRAVKGGDRELFPEGSFISFGNVIKNLHKILLRGELLELNSEEAIFGEDEVLDADEVEKLREHTDKFNSILNKAAENPRVHLVDMNKMLGDVKVDGRELRGAGPTMTVNAGYTGVRAEDGSAGLFSQDGTHPGDIGYAVIANELLTVAKESFPKTADFESVHKAEYLDEKEVLKKDPRYSKAESRPEIVIGVPGLSFPFFS